MDQDLQVAWRFLLKHRTATATIVLTLGIAVGFSTIAIGALDSALWRAIRAPEGGSLLTVYNTRPAVPQYQVLSYDDYVDVRDRLRDRVDVGAFFRIENTLEDVAQPTRIRGELVSDNYFRVLGATALMGRLIGDADTTDAPVAVLSYETWRNRFGGDPHVVGRAIQLGRERLAIIGVASPGFQDPAYPSEFWAPLASTSQLLGEDLSRMHVPYLQTIARPRPGVTRQQVQAYIASIPTNESRDGWRLAALPGTYLRFWPAYRSAVAQVLWIFTALAIGILFIACANVAGLQLARGAERARELAVRQALGATHLQLLRRLAAESILLAAAGEAIGLLFAWWSAPLFRRIPMPVPAPITLAFNWRMVVISLAISVVASLFFTAVAAWKGLRTEVQRVLLTSSRGLTTRTFAQRALVVTQLAVGCIVATAAMLLGRSLWNVQHVNVGFETANRVGARVSLSDQNYSTSQAAIFYRRLEEALRRTRGVEDVAFEQDAVLEVVRAVGRFRPESAEPVSARYDAVSPGYFRTLGIPAVSGRVFDDRDTAASEPVIVINQTMARLLGEHPLGEMLTEDSRAWGLRSGTRVRIIGIVKDAQYNAITEPPQPYVYLPIAQSPHPDLEVYIHARMPQGEALALLCSEVHRLDPRVSLSDAGTLTDRVSTAETLPRSSAIAAAALAGVAIFLALVGVYGVMTTSIENQRRELAIRSALGASTFSLVQRVVGEGTLLTVGALAAGIVGSLAGARALGGLLFGVQPYDLWSLVGGVCFVLAASVVAWIGPARRAANVDPISVLRAE